MANDKEITQRRQVRCAACKEDFSYIIRVTQAQLEQPELLVKVTCPFCSAKLSVNISPWCRRIVTTSKGVSGEPAGEEKWELADLPYELPSQLQGDRRNCHAATITLHHSTAGGFHRQASLPARCSQATV